MYWIPIITTLVIVIQLFLLGDDDKPIHPIKKAIIILLSSIMWITTFIIATTHSRFITEIINDYHEGTIIKVESITIEGTDTTKVIKYQYK